MSHQSFPHALRRACSMSGNVPWLAESVRSGNIDSYVDQVARAIQIWWNQAPADMRNELKDGFLDSFPKDFREHLRQISERRQLKRVLFPRGEECHIRPADYAKAVPGLLAALTNPMVAPREIFRTDAKIILHYPYQGFVTIAHLEGTVQVGYQPYQHLHVHLRNFNRPEEDSLHGQMHAILRRQYGDECQKNLRAVDVVENGWLIAQQLGAMLTVTHQEGGDPDYAAYSYYGPFYPHEFRVREDDGNYAFEYAFDFVTLSL